MAIVNKFNVNNKQVTLDADIIENMSANDVPYDSSFQYDENTVGDKLSELEYDVTANNDGATFASLSALLSDENLSTLIPTSVRHGGMSIRFVQSSDNKYVQYKLMSDTFNTTPDNWQGVELMVKDSTIADVDFSLCDDSGNAILLLKKGGIQTKEFDSEELRLRVKNTKITEIDFALTDEQNNILLELIDGHIKTKNFDSSKLNSRHFSSFSVIGDSYSAFKNYTRSENAVWYPTDDLTAEGYESGNDVVKIEQMWFYLFAKEYGCALIQNESYSGSTICYDGYSPGHDSSAAEASFLKRVERMTKSCELFIIFGGTNDSWAKSSIGNYKYSDWTEEDKEYFRPALAYLIDYINKHHIGSQILFILNNGLSVDINTSVLTICEHYMVPVLQLTAISKISNHPSISGMTEIKNQLIKFLK